MAKNHCTGNACPVKTSNQPPLADGQACALLAKAIDTAELAQGIKTTPTINTPLKKQKPRSVMSGASF